MVFCCDYDFVLLEVMRISERLFVVFLIFFIVVFCSNLWIWEDIVKYLFNLDVNFVYYDFKIWFMCEDLFLDSDLNEKFYEVCMCVVLF